MSELRLAVIADVHADENENKWTRVVAEPPAAARKRHPLRDLPDLLERENITADYLIAPGDIANQADTGGLVYCWRRLQEIKSQLKATLLGVPGNHDVITHQPAGDPRFMLKNLLPSFPTGDRDHDDTFWQTGWSLIEQASHRILLLDSTIGFPPYPVGVDRKSLAFNDYLVELDRGRLTTEIERAIDERLTDCSSSKLNVAIIHHHPQEHQLRDYLKDTYGPMHRGSELIEILSSHPQSGRWIIIHGHKHVPQLVNAVSTTSNGPLILCAGSLGATLWDPVNTVTRNQFHIVTITNEQVSGAGSLCGTVETYTWGFGEGWFVTDRKGSGLPPHGGFGCAEDFRTISERIVEIMESESLAFMRYSELAQRVPQLPYQLPMDFEYLQDDLEQRGFGFDRDRRHRLTQISRLAAL